MAWNRSIFANLGVLSGVALPLFIGMTLVSCAGTDPSVQTKVNENPNQFRAGTAVADTLASRMPEFARSVFKSFIDSVPGEYYYHATDGIIDTLFQKEGEQYKPVVSIVYGSLNGQSNYELKKGNYSYVIKDGVLAAEEDFPKYYKEYWDNGGLKVIATGALYRNDQGNTALDSGSAVLYFENGKISEQSDWKDKHAIAYKVWNESGVLIEELDFPKHFKGYWDNGKTKNVLTGILYEANQGGYELDSGHSEIYFENGKINQQNDWKDKKLIAQKEWNENGTLIKEIVFPNYVKEYWDNGKIKQMATGTFYRDNQGGFSLDSGRSENYFEIGKTKQLSDWKDKQVVAGKTWNENGVLINEIDFPKSAKEYWDNGNPKAILTGLLYWDDQGTVQVDSGHSEIYFENGKIQQQNDWKDKRIVTQKRWNENDLMIKDIDFSKSAKTYWDNGNPKTIMTGLLYWDAQGAVQVDSGHIETYFENGKIEKTPDWRNKQYIKQKEWDENGLLITELDFPKSAKEYWDNGKLKTVLTGLLYRDNKDDQNSFAVDSGRTETYFRSGEIEEQNDWKDKQPVASKQWNEKGVLVKELAFPQYIKEYWDNGKPKAVLTGLLYRDDYGGFHLDNGHSEMYFENGKIKGKSVSKDKQLVARKEWNESGVLIKDLDFPKYYKEYRDNGTLSFESEGTLYYDNLRKLQVQDGSQTWYRDNGKVWIRQIHKRKKLVSKMMWNDDGTVTKLQ